MQFGDLEVYSEDAWMSVSVSFNPYQCDLSPLTVSYPLSLGVLVASLSFKPAAHLRKQLSKLPYEESLGHVRQSAQLFPQVCG